MALFKNINPLKSSVFFGVLSFLKSGVSFILLPVFLNYLSTSDYGIISLVIIYANIIGIIASIGLKSAVFTFYYDFREKSEIRNYIGHIFTLNLLSFILVFIIHIFFGNKIFNLIFISDTISFKDYGLLALAAVFFESLNNLFFVYLKNEINLKTFSKYIITAIVLTISLQLLLVVFLDLKIIGILAGQLMANAIVFCFICLNNLDFFKFKLEKTVLLPSLKYSLKLLPFLLFFFLESRIDRYLIELNLGLDKVGIYALLIKIFGILLIGINALDDGIRPFLYRILKKSNTTLATLYFNIYLAIGILFLGAINFIGLHLDYIITNQNFLEIKEYFFITSIIFVIIIPIRFLGLILVFYKKSSSLSLATFIKLCIVVTFMLILIPKYQIYGALYALAISYVINAILFLYFSRKKMRLHLNKKTIVYIILFFVSNYILSLKSEVFNTTIIAVVYLLMLSTIFIKLYYKDVKTLILNTN